jgi:hypothetical protein
MRQIQYQYHWFFLMQYRHTPKGTKQVRQFFILISLYMSCLSSYMKMSYFDHTWYSGYFLQKKFCKYLLEFTYNAQFIKRVGQSFYVLGSFIFLSWTLFHINCWSNTILTVNILKYKVNSAQLDYENMSIMSL